MAIGTLLGGLTRIFSGAGGLTAGRTAAAGIFSAAGRRALVGLPPTARELARRAAAAAGAGAAFGAGAELVESFVPFGVEGLDIGTRRRRRMNPCNPKALRRALRRVESFRNFAHRSGLLTRVRRVAPRGGRRRR